MDVSDLMGNSTKDTEPEFVDFETAVQEIIYRPGSLI